MTKTLILSWTIPPSTTGSSILVNNLAKRLPADEFVVAGESINFKNYSGNVQLLKAYYLNPFIIPVGRRFLKWLKFFTIVKLLKDIIQKEDCGRVLCCFPDEFYALVAYRTCRSLNIPMYLWMHNTYKENRKGLLYLVSIFVQPKLFRFANNIFVISDGLLNFYKTKYPSYKFSLLQHGFEITKSKLQIKAKFVGPIRFAYTGSLNESCLDAAFRIFKIILSNSRFELHIFSGQPLSVFKDLGIDGNIVYHGFIPEELFLEALEKIDFMILPHGFEGKRSKIEFKTIFPTRTIPYLCSGRPIIAHSPEGCFLSEFLKSNNCAEVIEDIDTVKIESKINSLIINFNRQELLVNNAKIIADFFDLNEVCYKLKEFLSDEEE